MARVRRLGLIALLAGILPLVVPVAASAQMREFTGKVDKINNKQVIVDNRQGDKVKFNKVEDAVVEGEKSTWEDVSKGDWVTVHWKFVDKPRRAYKVVVLPPKDEAGEDE